MAADPKQRRAARHGQPGAGTSAPPPQKLPLSVARITDTALGIVATQGYDALTMRSVAAALGTGPASLYAHVVNKADLDELVIGRLCARLRLPEPDPARWRKQIADVCTQLREQYLRHPGVSRAAMAMEVTNLDVLRVNEGMLAILLAGGMAPRAAAWTMDALVLYVAAYTLEISLRHPQGSGGGDTWLVGREQREEVVRRFAALPAEEFPQTRRNAWELTSGAGHERFDFTVGLILGQPVEPAAPADGPQTATGAPSS